MLLYFHSKLILEMLNFKLLSFDQSRVLTGVLGLTCRLRLIYLLLKQLDVQF